MGEFFAIGICAVVMWVYSFGVWKEYNEERELYGTDPLPALKMALVWPWHALTGRKG